MSAGLTPSSCITEATPLSLTDARSDLAAAEDAPNGWYTPHIGDGQTYVADGHEAIRIIDELLRELHRLRSAVIGKIRADQDERAARVDRHLADIRTDREAATAAVAEMRPEAGA
jgi:hypothetical protein